MFSKDLAEAIQRGATEKAKTVPLGKDRTMSVSNIGDEDVTSFNIPTEDGVKVAIMLRGSQSAVGPKSGMAEIVYPGMKKDGFRSPMPVTIAQALKIKSIVPQVTRKELPAAIRKELGR